MAWDEIKFKISADMDFGDAISQVTTIKDGINGLKNSMSDMPNVSRIFNSSFDKAAIVSEELVSNMRKLQSSDLSEEKRAKIEKEAKTNAAELNALRSIQLGTTDFSAEIAKKWFGNLPQNIQHQFDEMAPRLSAIIRNRMSSLSKYGNNHISSTAPGAISKVLMGMEGGRPNQAKMDADIQRLVKSFNLNSEGLYQLEDFIRYLVPSVSAMNKFSTYQQKRYGAARLNKRANLFSGSPEELFPASFKETFRSEGRIFNNFDTSYQSKVLDTQYRKQLDNVLRTYPIAVKAALQAGISRRDSRGILETKDEITRSQWEDFRKALYDDMIVRVSGYKGNEIDAYHATGSNKKKLMSRLTSSSSGRAMLALHDIEKMEDTAAWTNAAGTDTWRSLPSEGKRILNQHVVTKYSPFMPGAEKTMIMIPESHNTRLLGNGQWRNNQDISDTVAIVSLNGYNPNNKEHKASLESLFANGKQINGSTYVAQSIHGTGSDTIVRMIEKSAFDRVNQQEREWINSHPDEAVKGIRGTYWGNFDDAEISRLIQKGIGTEKTEGITSKVWGKHLEALNKAWTPTADMGINVDGKRFAVVNMRGFGDGGAWFSNAVMPHSGQFRGGVGLKGSAFVFEGNGVGALGRKAGLVDDQGRMMMEGPDGRLYDVSGYDGLIPLDVIKNKGMLKDENGKYVSGEIASRRMTAMLQRHPIGYHVDYDLEDKASGHIGTQMASFMMFAPEVRKHQIQMAKRVLDALDTESGQLKYVFGNEEDYLSRKVHENTSLLATDEAQARIDAKRASILKNLIGGQYMDFEDDASISNLRAVANPIASILLAEEERIKEEQLKNPNYTSESGISQNKVIQQARKFLDQDAEQKRRLDPNYIAPQYTDQQIRDMIILPEGHVLDFSHPEKKTIGISRSPTGFGNMYVAKNMAEAALPIYKGFGETTTAGIYVSNANLDQLQSMDFDADTVKAIYDEAIRNSIIEASKTMKYQKEQVKEKGIEFTPEELLSSTIQQRSYTERSLQASLGMGTGSSGIRIMQVDYNTPENQWLVKAARRMAGIYDIASTPKKGTTYELENEDPVWAALGLGKEYTKFSDNIDNLFQLDDDMKDQFGNAKKHPDLFKTKTGKEINLRALRDMKLDEINLPSRYMANHLMAISGINDYYKHGLVDTTQLDAVYEALNSKLGYGDAGQSAKSLMQTIRTMMVQFATGERSYIADKEVPYIQDLIKAADAEIELNAKEYYDETSKTDKRNGKKYANRDAFIESQRKKYGVRTAENALGQFGITQSALSEMFGEDYFKENFSNYTDLFVRQEDQNALLLESREKQNAIEIDRLTKQRDAENASTKGKKKKTAEQKNIEKEITAAQKRLGITKDANVSESISMLDSAISYDEALLDSGMTMPADQIEHLRNSIAQNKQRRQALQDYKDLLGKRDAAAQTPTERTLAEALKERDAISEEKLANGKLMDLRLEFQSVIGEAEEYNSKLRGYRIGKEHKIDDDRTAAEKYWNRGAWQKQQEINVLDDLAERIQASDFDAKTKGNLGLRIGQVKEQINDNFIMDFADKAILTAKEVSEQISEELTNQQSAPTKQKKKLDQYDKNIEDAKTYVDRMQQAINNGDTNEQQTKAYKESIEKTNEYLANAEAAKNELIAEYTKKNEEAGKEMLEALQIKQGARKKNSAQVVANARKREIQQARSLVDKQYKEGNYSEEQYKNISAELDKLESRATPAAVAFNQAFNTVKMRAQSTLSYMTNMFARQLFRKAINEAKRFVKEFEKSMTTIQMITLKTDEQMSTLGDTLIDKAKELKISVSEITKSAETLYRQGLSDEEVNERLDVISKFSKVSGTKVDDATKLITVAMNTGLVSDPQLAADIVTALGDNAATNAAQIEKGIEKAGAAAAADGTTFAQLASMLTAITSTTQIGGNVAGRTLNTIFGRMNKIGTNELIVDENGNMVSGSAVAKLLKAQGINMYDANGNKRSSYDTLYALSQKWENMTDAEQQQMANAIAGTRQYSNFAAIMQGMSEGKVDEYMALTASAEGITDKKFDVYADSLEASLTNLRNTFDELVHDLTENKTLTGIIDFISRVVKGIDNISNAVGGLGAALLVILPTVASFAVMMAGIQSGNWYLALGGALATGISLLVTSAFGNEEKKSASEIYTERLSNIESNYGTSNKAISRYNELKNKKTLTDEEKKEYLSLFDEIALISGVDKTSKEFIELRDSIKNTGDIAADAKSKLDKYAEAMEKEAEKRITQNRFNAIREAYDEFGDKFETAIKEVSFAFDTKNFDSSLNPYIANVLRTSPGEAERRTLGYTDDLNSVNKGALYSTGGASVLPSFAFALANTQEKFSQDFYKPLDRQYGKERLSAKDLQYNLGQVIKKTQTGVDLFDTIALGIKAATSQNIQTLFGTWEEIKPYLVKAFQHAGNNTPGYENIPDWSQYVEDLRNGKVTLSQELTDSLYDWLDTQEGQYTTKVASERNTGVEIMKNRLSDFGFDLPEDELEMLANIEYDKYMEEMDALIQEYGVDAAQEYADVAAKKAEDAILGSGETYEEVLAHLREVLLDNKYISKSTLYRNTGIEYAGAGGYYIDKNGRRYSENEMDKAVKANEEIQSHLLSLFDVGKHTKKIWSYTDTAGNEQIFSDYNAAVNSINKTNKSADLETFKTALSEGRFIEYINPIRGATPVGNETKSEAVRRAFSTFLDKYYDFSDDQKNDIIAKYLPSLLREDLRSSDIAHKFYTDTAFSNNIKKKQDYIPIDAIKPKEINTYNVSEWINANKEYLQSDEGQQLLEQIPESLRDKIVGGIGEFAESELKTIDEVALEISKLTTFEGIKTVKDHFKAGIDQAADKWEQNNAIGLTADDMLERISSRNLTTLQQVKDFINEEDIQEWETLSRNSPELAEIEKIINETDTGRIQNLNADVILSDLLYTLSGLSYSHGKAYISSYDKYNLASEAYAGYARSKTDKNFYVSQQAAERAAKAEEERQREIWEEKYNTAYENQNFKLNGEVMDVDEVNRYNEWRNNYLRWNPEPMSTEDILSTYSWISKEQLDSLKGVAPEGIMSKLSNGMTLSSFEEDYLKTLTENGKIGITGPTEAQRYSKLQEIMSAAKSGQYADFIKGTDASAISAYTSGIQGLDQYLAVQAYAGTDEYNDKIVELYGSLDNFKAKEEEIQDAIAQTGQQLETSGDYLDSYSVGLKKTSSSLKESNNATKSWNQTLTQILRNQKARTEYAKNGGWTDEIASMTGLSEEFVKDKANKDKTKEILDAQEQEDINIIESYASGMLNDINTTLAGTFDGQEFDVAFPGVNLTGVDGAIDFDAVAATIGSDAANAMQALAQELAQLGITTHFEETENAEGAPQIKLVVDSLGSGAGRRSGGGGKSKVDKLLEEQKHRLMPIEHENKLLEIESKKLDYKNDFTGLGSNLEERIALQQKLTAAYKENLKELTDQLAKTKEGSDDYWKLQEAINSTNESLADQENILNDLNQQRITNLQQSQEIADKPGTQISTMLDELASRAMTEERFIDYENLTTQIIENINATKELNDAQLSQWENELTNFEEGSDGWIEVRDKIWAIEAENADLENQAIEKQNELYEQRLAQMTKVLQYNTEYAAQKSGVASTYGNYYQSAGYRYQYSKTIDVQRASNETLIAENKKALDAAQAQMNSLDAMTPAWISARSAVYSYQQTLAELTVSQWELNRAMNENNLGAVTDKYSDLTREYSHVNELLSNEMQEMLDRNDFNGYDEAAKRAIQNLDTIIKDDEIYYNDLLSLYNEGMANATLDSDEQRNLLDKINEAETNKQRDEIARAKTERERRKVELDRILELQDREASKDEHNLKLIGYQSSVYQTNGELTNVNTAIAAENKIREASVKRYKEEIQVLEERRKTAEAGSEEDERLVEQIKKKEEAIKSETAQIEKNNKAIEDNTLKIKKLQKAIEDSVNSEIEAQKKREREILSANVSMQDTIVNILKERLQKEWDLKKKDIEKEKESLNEYKKLINERFSYRKKASEQADKEQDLAEYKRQLSLIQADPTRSKDAKELQRKIDELEKEKSWSIAEDELDAENQRIDENVEGLDRYVTYNEEKLAQLLSDANNFANELNGIITGSFQESYDNIIAFMQKENEAFMKSLPDAQKQMINSWEDTWKLANDIVDNNYERIQEIVSSKDSYLEFMKTNREYRSLVEAGDENSMAIKIQEWSDRWDDYQNAVKNTAEIDLHDHKIAEAVSTLLGSEYDIDSKYITAWTKGADYYANPNTDIQWWDRSTGETYTLKDYTGIGKIAEDVEAEVNDIADDVSDIAETITGNSNGKNKNFLLSYYGGEGSNPGDLRSVVVSARNAKEAKEEFVKKHSDVYISGVSETTLPVTQEATESNFSRWEAEKIAKRRQEIQTEIKAMQGTIARHEEDRQKQWSRWEKTYNSTSEHYNNAKERQDAYDKVIENSTKIGELKRKIDALNDELNNLPKFEKGGLVDYTGLARVDGTKTRPESFLDATDTSLLRSMLDSFKYVTTLPYMSHIDSSMFKGDTNIGDINVTINQAEINSDADINKLAKQVGEAFSKELRNNGLSLTGYSFA